MNRVNWGHKSKTAKNCKDKEKEKEHFRKEANSHVATDDDGEEGNVWEGAIVITVQR